MKKLTALIALLALLACMLGGCAGDDPLAAIPNPVATIRLSDGKTMRFELFVQDAPNTVANFVELANSGFYNGMRFFRIVPGASHTNVLFDAVVPMDCEMSESEVKAEIGRLVHTMEGNCFAVVEIDRSYV